MNGDTEVKGVTPVVTDNLDNTYTVTYEDLPLNDKNGNEIKYTVKEDEVTGYDADKSTVENGGTITNTQEKADPKDPTDPKDPSGNDDPKDPSNTTDNGGGKTTVTKKVTSVIKTGDAGNVLLYGSALVCATVLVVFLVQIRKRKRYHSR